MISFTIITPVFNAENEVEATLKSVREQSYPLVEHIILDNCSTDNTVSLCFNYKQQNDEAQSSHDVKVITEPDKGLYDAMNKGIEMASNDYIVFLNAGDRLPQSDTLETIAANVGEGESLPAVLYGDTEIISREGRVIGKRHKRPPQNLSWRSFKWGMLVCHQAFYALTDIAKQTPYNLNYKYSSDVDWCIRIMKTAAKEKRPLRNVNQVIAHFLEGGMSMKHHKASLEERFQLMRHHYGLPTTLFTHCCFAVKKIIENI